MSEHVVCSLDELPSGAARRVDIDGHRIALIRCEDDVYAIGDRCTHADISLSEGEVLCDEREVECWKHGSTFSLVTGEPQSLPATKPVPVYGARVEGNNIVVSVDEGGQ
jgi:3-phenylpropionate/trans-cinnamate dioxygenase ferredoxin subunit